ncbi:hypothetical protein ACFV0Z_20835 [Streptomyces xiamenensis]|uniref:hypothetical protein n=1 Tax=Streptomyces xiamenensis TaxID=408015 RepID=UPI0036A94E22
MPEAREQAGRVANPVTAGLAVVMVLVWLPVLGDAGDGGPAAGLPLLVSAMPSFALITVVGNLFWENGRPDGFVVPAIVAAQAMNVLVGGVVYGEVRAASRARKRLGPPGPGAG